MSRRIESPNAVQKAFKRSKERESLIRRYEQMCECGLDSNTKTEIKNWKTAKAACQCGREPKNICDTCGQAYTVNANYDKHDCDLAERAEGEL